MEHATVDFEIRIRRFRIDQSRYALHACAETSSVGGRRASTGRSPSTTCLELFCAKKLEIKVNDCAPTSRFRSRIMSTSDLLQQSLHALTNGLWITNILMSLLSVKVMQSVIRIVWWSLFGRLIIYLCNGITITYVWMVEPLIFLLKCALTYWVIIARNSHDWP